ncbi:hypothetical protein L1987_63797 [Smallanthus sonchifolius]|uniref:Uncharacterized protein n=1 Tax=Smallanthus sonchifolius TaxID=185202 RepID=A0ACB9CEA6_9ASTR|nr:hypothetical protein L1987_63797 [Smallanthus sonchifolius]
MIPMLPFSPPTGHVNAYARVDKATSEFLNCPDWRINIAICDTINSKPWLARDYIRAARSRLQQRNPNVQLLSLTNYGVEFPRRSPNTVPVITPPATHGHHQAGASSSTRHEPVENVSLSTLDSMRNALDLLSEMLQAVDPKDRRAMKDEVIVDLYDQCRSNQKKLGQTLSSTTDEEILRRGIQFNDILQYIIEKYDAIASGSPVPVKPPSLLTHPLWVKQTEVKPESSVAASASISNEIQEEPIDSALIDSRRNGPQTVYQNRTEVSASKSDKKPLLDPSLAMALVPTDPPPPANKKFIEEDMIDLFSVPLSPTGPYISNPNQTPTCSTIMENQPQLQLTNSYAVPWAQTRPQLKYEPQPPLQTVEQPPNYIPPPWAPTPGYYCNPYASTYSASTYYNGSSSGAGLNPYIPSNRLFEDLNILGNMRTNGSPGASGQFMLGNRK